MNRHYAPPGLAQIHQHVTMVLAGNAIPSFKGITVRTLGTPATAVNQHGHARAACPRCWNLRHLMSTGFYTKDQAIIDKYNPAKGQACFGCKGRTYFQLPSIDEMNVFIQLWCGWKVIEEGNLGEVRTLAFSEQAKIKEKIKASDALARKRGADIDLCQWERAILPTWQAMIIAYQRANAGGAFYPPGYPLAHRLGALAFKIKDNVSVQTQDDILARMDQLLAELED